MGTFLNGLSISELRRIRRGNHSPGSPLAVVLGSNQKSSKPVLRAVLAL